LGAFQTLVPQPPLSGLSWTKHRTGCRDFQEGWIGVGVLVYSEVEMAEKRSLTSQEISDLVNRIANEFESEGRAEIEMIAKMRPEQRWLVSYRKSEAIRSDLRNKLRIDFPELSFPEINMKVLRSLTPVRMGKTYTEPAYYGWLC
jgi:hypothetical protein